MKIISPDEQKCEKKSPFVKSEALKIFLFFSTVKGLKVTPVN
jgi:hypothetical protein